MFEKILVPVDFSEHARAAFGHGVLFASAFGGTLELVHVVEAVAHAHQTFWAAEPALAIELQDLALRNARASLDKLVPSLPNVVGARIETRVLSGTLPGTLVDHASESKAGLMVIATHGRTGLSRWLMGSVSERLLRGAPCPVLVARGGSGDTVPALRSVLVAVDLSELSRRALSMAGVVAATFGATLEVLYVWAAPYYDDSSPHEGLFERIRESARQELDEFVATAQLPADLPVKSVIVSGAPTAKIGERVHDLKPDLLVLGTHGHSGFRRMVLGSVAEATVRYAACATLVVP